MSLAELTHHHLPRFTAGGVTVRGFTMSNVTVIFLPANTTSVLQPLDAGINCTFKAYWRKRHLAWVIAELDTDVAARGSHTAADFKPDVKQTIEWASSAWALVRPPSVVCAQHTHTCMAECRCACASVLCACVRVHFL